MPVESSEGTALRRQSHRAMAPAREDPRPVETEGVRIPRGGIHDRELPGSDAVDALEDAPAHRFRPSVIAVMVSRRHEHDARPFLLGQAESDHVGALLPGERTARARRLEGGAENHDGKAVRRQGDAQRLQLTAMEGREAADQDGDFVCAGRRGRAGRAGFHGFRYRVCKRPTIHRPAVPVALAASRAALRVGLES